MSTTERRTGYYEGGRHEDQFAKAEREARQLVEDGERIMAATRADRQRKATFATVQPKYLAIRSMAMHTLGMRDAGDAATRRRILHADPTYQSLPARERAEWDAAVDGATETLETGDAGAVWRSIESLARQQASEDGLASWDPPTPEGEDPASLAARIPRG